MSFEKSVFVNCPFDRAYLPLLRPLLFTILYLDLEPRIASESLDSGSPRIEKIVRLIRESRFAVHDLSRLEASRVGEISRFNMPFELGLDVGCRLFGGGASGGKRCLILEEKPYRYQAAISDLSNSDIAVHRSEPEALVEQVRNWLNNEADLDADGPARIWGSFLDFMTWNYESLRERGFAKKNVEALPIAELLRNMRGWLSDRPALEA